MAACERNLRAANFILICVSAATAQRTKVFGYVFGLLGVTSFSLTLPATRVAVQGIDAILLASGRALLAAAIGTICLFIARAPRPRRADWPGLAVVGLCLGIGFPQCASIGARDATSAHGAVILGLLPLFTTLAGMLRMRERPSLAFWFSGLLGSGAVIAYAWWQHPVGGQGGADAALFAAAIIASFGYAESARLAAALGSWQVVCWALLLVAPANLAISAWRMGSHAPFNATPIAWFSFAYVATMSQLFGVMLWTRGLQLGGVSRVGQLQLLMPFLTFIASAWWLRETLSPAMFFAAMVVLVSIVLSRRAPVLQPDSESRFPGPAGQSAPLLPRAPVCAGARRD